MDLFSMVLTEQKFDFDFQGGQKVGPSKFCGSTTKIKEYFKIFPL